MSNLYEKVTIVGDDGTPLLVNPDGSIVVDGAGGGAPADAQYVVIAADATLTDERVLTAGAGVAVTDGGAGSTVTVAAAADGWYAAGETWTYASADDPTFTFTITGDLTTKYSAGMRAKLTQTTTKYFIVTKVEHAAGTTTVTLYGGTDYDLANAAITNPYYSMFKAPFGFPLDPAKWTVEVTDTGNQSQATPTNTTWYNLGSVTISIPIGSWNVGYSVVLATDRAASSSSCGGYCTLSTANNTESDKSMSGATSMADAAATNKGSWGTITRERHLTLAAKASYYLNSMSDYTLSAIANRGDVATTVIRAVCAYL